jgi:hypothetical protein
MRYPQANSVGCSTHTAKGSANYAFALLLKKAGKAAEALAERIPSVSDSNGDRTAMTLRLFWIAIQRLAG